ncbi:MAG: LysE family translocator [Flavobacteriaceae bacterium]
MLWEFVLACILIELMPGPNMGYLAALALDRGRGAGMMAVAGVALGLTLAAIAAGLGLAAVVAASPVIWEALRWAGVAYLLWLGWEMWREADRDVMEDADGEQARYFRRGLLANLLSPKT